MITRWCVATTLVVSVGLPCNASAQGSVEEMLLRRTTALKSQVRAIDTQISSLRSRIPVIEEEIDRLSAEIRTLKVPDPEEEIEEAPKRPPRQIPFRPPLEREVDKDSPIALICKNNRVALLDLDEKTRELEALMEDQAALERFIKAGGGSFSAGDFKVRINFEVRGRNLYISQELERKPGRDGEVLEDALRSGSPLLRRLAELNAERSVIQFAVYPDSFSVFRSVRHRVWDGKFGVTWLPLPNGEMISIGAGPITQQ